MTIGVIRRLLHQAERLLADVEREQPHHHHPLPPPPPPHLHHPPSLPPAPRQYRLLRALFWTLVGGAVTRRLLRR
jgi:hypothetical protein